MRVIGIDPGLTRCGVGIVEGTVGRLPTMIALGVVRTSPSLDVARRLVELESGLEEYFNRYAPEAVAIERVFSQHNLASVMDTAQAAGVAALVGARRGLSVTFHTPSEVKAAVSGSGSAGKAQVTQMVMRILRLEVAPKPADAADALAIAVTHVWRGGATNRYAAAVAAAKRR
ncbi:crossover junction endodeoxyribonuclease RuvC [Tessaracoccus flavus]|uniref:Crossover junction endodeoxyribonuclease RuvC n=1 Tax=Tessaracoccus flavus TaxID=1610493 RepID=A0A1Q2CIV9_9ACTN|nr:crossover junction endodeoxyribonuclease RuvC [Tessaracoccus flavus]SDY70554.1 Holliday junction endonuclease RuvC [Tessaracoccus flavus]